MNRLLWNQPEKLTAVVAAWAILLAPLAALGNCCCIASAATAQAGDPAQVAEDRIAPVSCCAGEQADVDVSEAVPACCAPRAAAPSQSSLDTTVPSCACELPCCDAQVGQAPAVVNPSSQQVIPLDWDAMPVALLAAPPRETRSAWSESSRESAFLSAHARCAMLCRWLN